jgi:hypothetical protein
MYLRASETATGSLSNGGVKRLQSEQSEVCFTFSWWGIGVYCLIVWYYLTVYKYYQKFNF